MSGDKKTNAGIQTESSRLLQIGGVIAVLPVDAFTGQAVLSRDFSVEIEGARPPVKKRDGSFVFFLVLTRCAAEGRKSIGGASVITIRLKGRGYQERVLRVPPEAISMEETVITVYMNPDASYPYPPHTVFMEGRLSANCCLFAALLKKMGSLRLAEDYHAGEETIALYRGGRSNLTGGLFYIEKERAVSDEEPRAVTENSALCGSFLLLGEAECGGTGRYRLSAPLPDSFGRMEARLYPARMQKAGDQEVHYFFAFCEKGAVRRSGMADGGESEAGYDILCRVQMPEGVKDFRFFVESGETRVMDF